MIRGDDECAGAVDGQDAVVSKVATGRESTAVLKGETAGHVVDGEVQQGIEVRLVVNDPGSGPVQDDGGVAVVGKVAVEGPRAAAAGHNLDGAVFGVGEGAAADHRQRVEVGGVAR